MKSITIAYVAVVQAALIGTTIALVRGPNVHGFDLREVPAATPDDASLREVIGVEKVFRVLAPDGTHVVDVACDRTGTPVILTATVEGRRQIEVGPGRNIALREGDEDGTGWVVLDGDGDGVPEFRIETHDGGRSRFRYVAEARPWILVEREGNEQIERYHNEAGVEKIRLSAPRDQSEFDARVDVEYLSDDGTIVRTEAITLDQSMNTAWQTLADEAEW